MQILHGIFFHGKRQNCPKLADLRATRNLVANIEVLKGGFGFGMKKSLRMLFVGHTPLMGDSFPSCSLQWNR